MIEKKVKRRLQIQIVKNSFENGKRSWNYKKKKKKKLRILKLKVAHPCRTLPTRYPHFFGLWFSFSPEFIIISSQVDYIFMDLVSGLLTINSSPSNFLSNFLLFIHLYILVVKTSNLHTFMRMILYNYILSQH